MTYRYSAVCTAITLAVSFASSQASVQAADIPVKGAAPYFAPHTNWSGLYIGGHAGYGFGTANWGTNATVPGEQVSTSPTGWLAGGQLGYRFQVFQNWLVGAEVAGAYADISQTVASTVAPNRDRRTQLRSMFAVTGQVGMTWGDWLLYGKGGWVRGDVRREANNNNPGGFDVTWTQQADGWTAGAGAEYALWRNLSVGLEYAYYSLSVGQITAANSGGVVVRAGGSTFDIHAVTGRINYRFGSLF